MPGHLHRAGLWCRLLLSLRPPARRLLAEFVGTALLVTIVVGSGIAAERLSPGQSGLQLLENSIATALGLAVLILTFGPVSGGHFNPVITAVDWALGRRRAPASAGQTSLDISSPRRPAALPVPRSPT